MDGSATDYTDADLSAAAAAYDPAVSAAPIVRGHPTADAEALGWIGGLRYDAATGLLLGEAERVDPVFAAAHQAGRYRYHSASFWRPTAPTNPVPGALYLRHLGMVPIPAVKGLAVAQFAADASDPAEFLTIDFSAPAAPAADHPEDPMPDPTAEFAEREAAIAARQTQLEAQAAALAEREASIAAQRAALERDACISFAETLVTAGRVLPADRDLVAAVLERLAAGDAAPHADFADPGDTARTPRDPAAALRAWLARLPVQVDYAERTPKEPGTADHADPEAKAAAEWDRSPALKAEFSSKDSYLAYTRAANAGRVTISNRLTTEG